MFRHGKFRVWEELKCRQFATHKQKAFEGILLYNTYTDWMEHSNNKSTSHPHEHQNMTNQALQENENEHLNMATSQDEIDLVAKQMISFKTMENNKRGCTDESGMDVKDRNSHYRNGTNLGSSSSSSHPASEQPPSVKRQKTSKSSATTSSLSSDSLNCGHSNTTAPAAASKSQLDLPSTKTKDGKMKIHDRGVGTKTFSDNDGKFLVLPGQH